ncbi:MAG TPA: protein kinase [Streptosporangiaceae bacterium]|nr:protein kinase [Streptosporangiaceae bacterium]
MDDEVPAEIGPYQVVRLLGEGGMGRVYLARSAGSRLAAVKVVRPEYASPGFRDRFRREVKAAKKVGGFLTAPVLTADPDGELPWLATAYVPAPTLGEAIEQFGPMREPALRTLGAGLAEALAAIHSAGLVHRDLKPGNILIALNGPQVIDFGISKALDGTHLTRAGIPVGTPGYLAPEQVASGRLAVPASDVFSLGAVLVFAATGAGPFGTGDTQALLHRVVHDEPHLDTIPAAMRPLLAACLDKNPAARPPVTALLKWLRPVDPASLVSPQLRGEIARREREAAQLTNSRAFEPPLWWPTLPPHAGPGRRRMLALAAIGSASALAAGGTVTALIGGGRRTAKAASANLRPTWTYTQPHTFGSTGLTLAGSTLVWWDDQLALGIGAETGAHLWTGPGEVAGNWDQVTWLGVFGSILFGSFSTDDASLLLGMDARNGKQAFLHSLGAWDIGYSGVNDVGGGVALVSLTSDRSAALGTVDLSDGAVLWTRDQSLSPAWVGAVTNGRECFTLDGTTIRRLDVRTGAQRWAAPNAIAPGVDANLALAGDTLIVTSDRILALDTASGRRLWAGVTDNPSGTAAHGTRIYLVDSDFNRVRSIDARSGITIWTTPSAFSLSLSQFGMSVSDELISIPLLGPPGGVQVLRTSDGRTLWTYQAPTPQDNRPGWAALAAGNVVYASSPTSLFAFREQAR